MADLIAARDAARAFAAEHVAELARDINDWQDTGLLPDRKLRDLADICKAMDERHSMSLAEHYANRACRDAAALASAPAATQGEAVAWEYRNLYGKRFLSLDDPNKWHPHDQEGFKEFRALAYTTPQPTAPARAAEATQPAAAPGYKLVPMIPTPAMNRVMDSEGWAWEDLLAAACAITEDEYEQIAGSGTFQPAPPAAAEQRDAQRYRKMRAWFVAEGRRSDITPNGHICIITAADVDAGVDALPPSQAPAGVEAAQQGQDALPCPFCGAVGLEFGQGSTFRWITAECAGCGATTGETRIQTFGEGTREEWLTDARQDAIKAWNTRAATSAKSHPQEGRMP
jgi:hypothetical protein